MNDPTQLAHQYTPAQARAVRLARAHRDGSWQRKYRTWAEYVAAESDVSLGHSYNVVALGEAVIAHDALGGAPEDRPSLNRANGITEPRPTTARPARRRSEVKAWKRARARYPFLAEPQWDSVAKAQVVAYSDMLDDVPRAEFAELAAKIRQAWQS